MTSSAYPGFRVKNWAWVLKINNQNKWNIQNTRFVLRTKMPDDTASSWQVVFLPILENCGVKG